MSKATGCIIKYENVKIGDLFIVSGRYSQRLAKVTNVTKTRFRVGDVTFFKKDGSEYGGSSWSSNSCEIPTEEKIKELKEDIEKEKVIRALKELDFNKYSLNELNKVIEILKYK